MGIEPIFSERAVEALRDFLEPNGELLPFETARGRYWAYNLLTIADVLDRERSKPAWFNNGLARYVDWYRLHQDKLASLSIFYIPEQPREGFVTQQFVDCARSQGLDGFVFDLVWPLPRGTDWRLLAHAERKLLH